MNHPTDPSSEAAPAGNTRAWDQYWRDGRLASCGGAGGTNYQPAIIEGWRELFAQLPHSSRILDACTGNGAIARIAAEVAVARGVHFSIDAFDSAAIAPDKVPPGRGRGMISFRGHVTAENTPYAANRFDCVVAQYAIEYTELERSLVEMVRVSKSGARVRFVIHAKEGIVVAAARSQLNDVDRLFRTCDIFSSARRLAGLRANAAPEDGVRRAALDYRQEAQKLAQAAKSAVEPEMYRDTCNVIAQALSLQVRIGSSPVLNKIAEVEASVKAHAARLAAMLHAARDQAQAQDIAAHAQALWGKPFQCTRVLNAQNALIGWAVASVFTGTLTKPNVGRMTFSGPGDNTS